MQQVFLFYEPCGLKLLRDGSIVCIHHGLRVETCADRSDADEDKGYVIKIVYPGLTLAFCDFNITLLISGKTRTTFV